MALPLALFMVLLLSVVGSSMMFLSRTETLSSFNYKTLSQARYAAESGVQSATNHLLYTYIPAGTNGADPLATLVVDVAPPAYTGLPHTTSENPTSVRALVGSRVTLRGRRGDAAVLATLDTARVRPAKEDAMTQVRLPDGSTRELSAGATAADLAVVNRIASINTITEFEMLFPALEKAVVAATMGSTGDPALRDALLDLGGREEVHPRVCGVGMRRVGQDRLFHDRMRQALFRRDVADGQALQAAHAVGGGGNPYGKLAAADAPFGLPDVT